MAGATAVMYPISPTYEAGSREESTAIAGPTPQSIMCVDLGCATCRLENPFPKVPNPRYPQPTATCHRWINQESSSHSKFVGLVIGARIPRHAPYKCICRALLLRMSIRMEEYTELVEIVRYMYANSCQDHIRERKRIELCL